MKRAVLTTVLTICGGWLALGQTTEPPLKFEAADVHVSPKSTSQYSQTPAVRGGRYAVKNATMVDLVRIAYGFDADKVVGGPNWLELDRFDVVAKLPAGLTVDALADSATDPRKLMLQALLADRFKLVAHKDTRPIPTYVLSVARKPQLKEADGTGETGCKPSSSGPSGEGSVSVVMGNINGTSTTLRLDSGGTVQYACRNLTMAGLAEALHTMLGANVGSDPILDRTGLEGKWNFDVSYSMLFVGLPGSGGPRVSIAEALEKQVGLKLEQKPIPMPVLVVDSVNRQPSPNAPGLEKILPTAVAPTEFEVASVKPSDPGGRSGRFGMQSGGRLNSLGMPLRFLLGRAFDTNNRDQIVGAPAWVDSERFDIVAKAPSSGPNEPPLENSALAPMLLSLLKDRFKLAYHTEERTIPAYTLVAAKPKMKKADPDSRIFCKRANASAGAPPGSTVLTCQNITMALFAERLQGMSQELNWPVSDSTGLEGGWDFTLTFSPMTAMNIGGSRGGDSGPGGSSVPTASAPTGGLTVFEAIEKQLGLKLTVQKRPAQVFVIDHIEQKPTEN